MSPLPAAIPPGFAPPGFWPQGFVPDDASRYEVYARPTPEAPSGGGGGGDTLVATLLPEDVVDGLFSLTLTGQPFPGEQYLYVVAINRCGVPDGLPVGGRLRRMAFDDAGALIDPPPNPPRALSAQAGAAGDVTARWSYRTAGQEAAPASFHVYVAQGDPETNPHDFTTPDFVVSASGSGSTFSQSLGAFADGATVRCCVRAVSASGAEETNTDEASAVARTTGPAAPVSVTVGVSA